MVCVGCFLTNSSNAAPQQYEQRFRQTDRIPDAQPYNPNSIQRFQFDIPDTIDAYQPEDIPKVPIQLGERSK